MNVERLAIVGTGLMGASVGLAAKRAGVRSVIGFDADRHSSEDALGRGAVDRTASTLAEAVADADLVVVAAPVGQLSDLVAEILRASPERTTVTDVGSTKSRVCSATQSPRFVGGHPLGGSEARGPVHASAALLDGVTWFLTPTPLTRPERVDAVRRFVVELGATPVLVSPEVHDHLLVLTSQLPHALANVLVSQVAAAEGGELDPFVAAGPSLRDMTRVAGANRDLWLDVFLESADALAEGLAEHRSRVEELEAALRARDAAHLARWIDEAAGHRRRLDS